MSEAQQTGNRLGSDIDGILWPHSQLNASAMASIVVRHLLPVATTLWFGWSIAQFLLLSLFNTCFTMGCIAACGVSATSLQAMRQRRSIFEQISMWVTLLCVTLGITLMFTAMFGWVIVVLAPAGILRDRALWLSAAGIVVGALPGFVAQVRAELRANLSEKEHMRRDQPVTIVLVLSAAVVFIASGYAANWFGHYALIALMFAVTAFFIFRDLRPDLAHELARLGDKSPSLEPLKKTRQPLKAARKRIRPRIRPARPDRPDG